MALPVWKKKGLGEREKKSISVSASLFYRLEKTNHFFYLPQLCAATLLRSHLKDPIGLCIRALRFNHFHYKNIGRKKNFMTKISRWIMWNELWKWRQSHSWLWLMPPAILLQNRFNEMMQCNENSIHENKIVILNRILWQRLCHRVHLTAISTVSLLQTEMFEDKFMTTVLWSISWIYWKVQTYDDELQSKKSGNSGRYLNSRSLE